MTYERRSAAVNRIMTFLVVVTIAVVALWAIGGGLEEIPGESGLESLAEIR